MVPLPGRRTRSRRLAESFTRTSSWPVPGCAQKLRRGGHERVASATGRYRPRPPLSLFRAPIVNSHTSPDHGYGPTPPNPRLAELRGVLELLRGDVHLIFRRRSSADALEPMRFARSAARKPISAERSHGRALRTGVAHRRERDRHCAATAALDDATARQATPGACRRGRRSATVSMRGCGKATTPARCTTPAARRADRANSVVP
jgi:hypothetical protein